MAMQLWGALVMLYCAIMCIRDMKRIWEASKVDPGGWKEMYPSQDPRSRKIKHIVLMRGYKEPLDLLFSTMNSLREQTVARKIIMVVGLEEGSPSHYDEEIYREYRGVFNDLLVTRHPR